MKESIHAEYASFGGGAIEKSLFDYILKTLPEGSTILEFGSGFGTDQLLKHYKVISIEHDKKYFEQRPKNHKAYLAEIKNGWFDASVVREALKNHFDLMLVDGPPGKLRAGLIANISIFTGIKVPVIFDDVNRDIDHKAMVAFCERFGYDTSIYTGEEKNWAICSPNGGLKSVRKNKKCLYTVITGGYDHLLTPANIPYGFDMICFTDNPNLKSDVWHIVHLEPKDNTVKHQREIKILSHKYLPDYDLTIYVDGNIIIKQDISAIVEYYSGGFMTKRHPSRQNIYQEAEAIIKRQKARKIDVDKQIARYQSLGFNEEGLYETGVIIRDNSAEVKKLNEAWWNELRDYTHRDQLGLPYSASATGIEIKTFGKTLFERFFKIIPHAGKKIPITRVWHSTPADPDKNIGRAYNEFCNLIPNDEDWICLRDGDSMFILSDWPKHIEDILELHGDKYQLFGCVTNRLATTNQRPFPEDFENPDILQAKDRAEYCHKNKYSVVTPHNKPVAGLFMLFQKKTWKKTPFSENTINADTDFGFAVMNNGGRIGIIQGLYLFHYYRFHHPDPTNYRKHLLPA